MGAKWGARKMPVAAANWSQRMLPAALWVCCLQGSRCQLCPPIIDIVMKRVVDDPKYLATKSYCCPDVAHCSDNQEKHTARSGPYLSSCNRLQPLFRHNTIHRLLYAGNSAHELGPDMPVQCAGTALHLATCAWVGGSAMTRHQPSNSS